MTTGLGVVVLQVSRGRGSSGSGSSLPPITPLPPASAEPLVDPAASSRMEPAGGGARPEFPTADLADNSSSDTVSEAHAPGSGEAPATEPPVNAGEIAASATATGTEDAGTGSVEPGSDEVVVGADDPVDAKGTGTEPTKPRAASVDSGFTEEGTTSYVN